MKNAILIIGVTCCCTVFGANATDYSEASNIDGLQLAQSEYGTSASTGEGSLSQRYGPVQPNQSLWGIARPYQRKGVTMSQLMMAIFNRNPDAFDQGNINRLKVGAMLEIPGEKAIQSIDSHQAYREATSHIDAYETEVRERKVESGELEPLSQGPREPELTPVVSAVSLAQLEEIKIELEREEELAALPPEPKARVTKKKHKPPLFRYSYEVAVADDDNIRNAQNDIDIRSDQIASVSLKARGGKSLSSFSLWNFGGSATYNAFKTFDTLNNVDIEINTRYRFALSSGFTSPIYTLGARLGGLEFDTEMRDSTVLSLSADLTKWVTNTINMTTGWSYKLRESKSEVFDTTNNRLFINFDTNFSKTSLLYTTFAVVLGDSVSSASPTVDIIDVADAIEPDDAFGGVTTNQFAYRIDATTLVFTLGYNKIMTRSLSLDFSARFVDTEAKENSAVGYQRTILRASLLGRF